MVQIELVPDLSHCIEVVAKRAYKETAENLLAPGKGNEVLQERLELLRTFLETMDFKRLRRESEKYLMEGKKVKFVVYLQEGTLKYDLQIM